jgi:hypothetical protein
MTSAAVQITTAVELHDYLTKHKNFDFQPDHGRDVALYGALKRGLNLPHGEFKKALEARNTSAEAYLRALMAAAEPLASMYREILSYCGKSRFLRSRGGAHVAWDVKSDGEQIGFSIEDFRVFDEIRTRLDPSLETMCKVKNDIMDWLAHEVFAQNHRGLTSYDLDWSCVELFRVLAEARRLYGSAHPQLFGGLGRMYLNGSGGAVPKNLQALVEHHPDYPGYLAAAVRAFLPEDVESIASKFISLPFWKFRWQVYEIWNVAFALSEFQKVGFVLADNPEGASLIELGRQATLATHEGANASFIYQPTYRNNTGEEIRPDIVVTLGNQATYEKARLIIECKQRKALEITHLDEVRRKYESGLHAGDGELLIVNYDDAPPMTLPASTRTTLLGNVYPESASEATLRSFLKDSHIASLCRRETWFVDISMSMGSVLDSDLRQLLIDRCQKLKPGLFEVYGFAQDIARMGPSELYGSVVMSDSQQDENWQLAVLSPLRDKVHERLRDGGRRLFIVSDLAAEIDRSLSKDGNQPDRLAIIDPTRDTWLNDLLTAL